VGIPEYGTVDGRVSVGLYDFKDPKGRVPVAYTSLMRKYKVSSEEVLSECVRLGVSIQSEHLEYVAPVSKRGRPPSSCVSKKELSSKPSAGRGRPKKCVSEEVVSDSEDLFASLILKANQSRAEAVVDVVSEGSGAMEECEYVQKDSSVDDLADALSSLKVVSSAEVSGSGFMEEYEYEQKESSVVSAKSAAAKAVVAKSAAKSVSKSSSKSSSKSAAKSVSEPAAKSVVAAEPVVSEPVVSSKCKEESEEEEEEDRCKKIKENGVTYLRSVNTGVIYDYDSVVKNDDPIVVGKWDALKSKIIFKECDLSEEEYESDSE
jgi:hypothetical protein